MSRRHKAQKRELIPDPRYGDAILAKFINSLMKNGKKTTAEKVLYGALENIKNKTGQDSIKVFKPNPKVYEYAASKLESNPNDILFFSSNSWDIAGASSFGFQTIWVNRFKNKSERLPGNPLLEIKNLKDFLKYID